jgi:hypothetical protein
VKILERLVKWQIVLQEFSISEIEQTVNFAEMDKASASP